MQIRPHISQNQRIWRRKQSKDILVQPPQVVGEETKAEKGSDVATVGKSKG